MIEFTNDSSLRKCSTGHRLSTRGLEVLDSAFFTICASLRPDIADVEYSTDSDIAMCYDGLFCSHELVKLAYQQAMILDKDRFNEATLGVI